MCKNNVRKLLYFVGLVLCGSCKYIQLSALEMKMTTEQLKIRKLPVLIKFQHKLFEEESGQFALRSVRLSILFGIRRNFLSGRSQS